MRNKKIVVIGGGTGTYSTLLGLKKYPVDISVIVSMTDSGGSNRVIRDEFGLLPTSDLRQVMVALATGREESLLRKLFTYRYSLGMGISGMTFGNLFMAALSDILGSQTEAIKETCRLLHVKGNIIPVTLDNSQLVAKYDNGKQILGEHHIDEPTPEIGNHKIIELSAFPPATANKEALEAIEKANLIIFAPGDLYTSIISNLVIDGISQALSKTKAKKMYILNLMTKFGQTNNFKASDHLFELYKYLKNAVIDYVLVNSKLELSPFILEKYQEENSIVVEDDLDFSNPDPKPKIIRTNLVSDLIYEKHKSDNLVRSLVRHDPVKLAKAIVSLL